MNLKYILFFLMSFFLISNSYSLVNNSVAYYAFDNSTGNLYDSTGNGFNLTNNGATFVPGVLGEAISFDGTTSAISGDLNMDGDSTFSVSMWVKFDSFTGTQMFFTGEGSTTERYPDFFYSGGFINFGVNNVDGRASYSTASMSTDTWYHIVGTANSKNLQLFVNDLSVTNFTTGNNADFSNNGISLGERGDGTSAFSGDLDEVAVYNYVLNRTQVSELYNSGTGFNPYTPLGSIVTNISNYYNTENILIQVNATQGNTNLNYSLNGASNVSLGTAEQFNFSITAIEGQNNISFYFNEGNLTETFIVDTNAPNITIFNTSEINSYTIDWTTRFNYSDENIDSCQVSINNGANTSNCDTNFTFFYNGNNSILINVTDLAGNYNTASYTQFVNPPFYVYFNNNTANLENFTVNDTLYENVFNGLFYDLGVGSHLFNFKKGGYNEFNFTLNFTNSTSDLNYTFFTDPVFIQILLKDLNDGSTAPNNNYTIFITNTDNDDILVYNLDNTNNISVPNPYEENLNIKVSVILNTTLSNTLELITARQNVSIPIYLNFETTSPRIIEVLKSSLSEIPDNDVFLYKYISGEGFVLETIKSTNVLGQVSFNIIENTAIYNICSTYLGNTKCLSQVTFQNVETDPFQIVHDSTIVEKSESDFRFINWSYEENKNLTANTSQMTFTFDDRQVLTTSFCYNVSRYNGTDLNYVGEYCNNNPSGQVVNTFQLLSNQYLVYTFYFTQNSQVYTLTEVTSYGEKAEFTELVNTQVIDVLALFFIFLLISVSLNIKNVTFYNIMFLGGLIMIFGVQAYLNENYYNGLVWTFLFIKTIVLYLVKRGN